MSANDVRTIADDVLGAARTVQSTVSFKATTKDVLDAFWRLQDLLHRLVAHVYDNPLDVFVLNETSPSLVSTVVDALAKSNRSATFRIHAVKQACEAINASLVQLQRANEEQHYSAASNGN